MNNKEIQWHPPYIAAMNLEMEADREHFVFVPEYTLNTGALKIDLFIENTKSSPVSNEIGKLFRKYNIRNIKTPMTHSVLMNLLKHRHMQDFIKHREKRQIAELLKVLLYH